MATKYPRGGGATRGARSAGVRRGFIFGRALKWGRPSSVRIWARLSRMTYREYKLPPSQRSGVARYQKGNGEKYRIGFKYGLSKGRE